MVVVGSGVVVGSVVSGGVRTLTVWCSVLVLAVAGAPIAVFVVDGDAAVLDGPHATKTAPNAATAIPVRVLINAPIVAGLAWPLCD